MKKHQKWIPFLKAYGEITIVKTPTKLQAKFYKQGNPRHLFGPCGGSQG
jgi:hypothetical protein